jgi:hypothetical protein
MLTGMLADYLALVGAQSRPLAFGLMLARAGRMVDRFAPGRCAL